MSSYIVLCAYSFASYFFICEDTPKIPDDIIIQKIEDKPDFKINTRNISIFLDTECISIIDKVYEKDFQLFNYKNENILI